jgi:agrin
VTCELYSVCKSQGTGQSGICVCPTECVEEAQDVVIVESENNKVCGTDGQTYASECYMKIAACKKQQFIVVANKGDCGKKNVLYCLFGCTHSF